MRSLAELESVFEAPLSAANTEDSARALLAASEEVIEHWVVAREELPTQDEREGFRLLALHVPGGCVSLQPDYDGARASGCRKSPVYDGIGIQAPVFVHIR